MFKNRAMQLTMVKTPKETSSYTEGHTHIDFTEISTIAKEQTRNIGLMVLVGAVSLKLTDAICHIAENRLSK